MKEKKPGNVALVSVLILLSISIALLQTQKKGKEHPKYLYAHLEDKKINLLLAHTDFKKVSE